MNNKTTAILIFSIVALLGFGAVALKNNNKSSEMGSDSMSTHQEPEKKEETKPSSSSTVEETNMVTYKSFDVLPKSIKVKKGTTVTWTNEDTAKHDVTPDKETEEFKASELFGKGETYTVTFNTVGTYTYYCSPHPYMKGTIEVTE